MLTTVIFDMDGLLIDSEPLWRDAMREEFTAMGVEISAEQAAYTTGLRIVEVVDFWHNHFGWTARSKKQVIDDILDNVIDKVIKEGKAMDGLEYILEFFKQRSFKIGLASSSPLRLIEAAINHLGIADYFQVVSSAEYEVYGKPHPAVYLICAGLLESHPLECVAFEDSVTGMVAAKAARMKVVVVPEHDKREDMRFSLADIRLDSLADFTPEMLEKLSPRQPA